MDSLSYDVFLSHSSADQDRIVNHLYDYLTSHGISCFYSPVSITGGRTYTELIPPAIRDAKVFFLVYTENANSSDQVKREAEIANAEHKQLYCMRCTDEPFNNTLRYVFALCNFFDVTSDYDKCVYFDDILAEIKGLLHSTESSPRESVQQVPLQHSQVITKSERIDLSKKAQYAQDLYDQKEYKLALENAEPLAEKSPLAAYIAGRCYAFGDGCEKDFAKALSCFSKAKDSYLDAQRLYASILLFHSDTKKDKEKGFEIIRNLVVSDKVDAELKHKIRNTYGHALFYGIGCEVDHAKGVKQLKKAADDGDMDAAVFLGHALYFSDCGIRCRHMQG